MKAVAYSVICDCGAEMAVLRATPLPTLLVCRNDGSGCVNANKVIEAPANTLDLAGSQLSQSAGSSGSLSLPLVADVAGVTLTNMAAALAFFNASHRHALKADLTSFTQVRLVMNKQATAGAAASKVILRYRTAFDVTPANWLDIGTSEVNCVLTGQNTVVTSAWINLAAGARADVFICPLMSGGDGVLDPVVGNVVAQFK